MRRSPGKTFAVRKDRMHLLLFAAPVFAVLCIVVFNQLKSSLFFTAKDRVNVVFYGKQTVYFSLGKTDGVHYYISFYPDIKVKVPGGYGNYRVGGLGKLAYLEKKNEIIPRTFSVTTASTVDRFFHDPGTEIYYGKEEAGESGLVLPGLGTMLFAPSDCNPFDRLFLALRFMGKRKNQFSEIDYTSSLGTDEEFFQDKEFVRQYQGFLYNRLYRDEARTVQIYYRSSYNTAFFLSKIIEGDGIRVSDLAEKPDMTGNGKPCEVVEDAQRFSSSAQALARYFGCDLAKGETESSDIIMKLGNLEDVWEIL